jgi:hypothetical protein
LCPASNCRQNGHLSGAAALADRACRPSDRQKPWHFAGIGAGQIEQHILAVYWLVVLNDGGKSARDLAATASNFRKTA